MIETIFYFANSKTEYDANANSGNISARTISFVPTGNGVGDIYKNGIKYGCGISESTINEIINNLPFASTTQAGIIKLGKGLKSVGNDGTVDVDFTGLNGTDGINGLDGLVENILKTIINKNGTGVVVTPRSISGSTVAIADIKVGDTTKTIYAPTGSNSGSGSSEGKDYAITNFGKSGTSLTISQNNNTAKSVDIKDVVKSSIQNLIDNGDTIINNFGQKTQVLVDPTLTSGTQIATITVDGTSKTLYAPANSGGGDNPGGGSEPYDDTDIKNAIKNLQDRADATESDLRDLLDETEAEVREKFKNAFSTYEDLINYYRQSGDTTPTKFTFGKEDADEWASQMGLITPNGDGTYNVGWSTLTQSYNSLAGEVAQIKANQSVGGEIDYEALQAGLYSYINENAATSGMDSTWGKFVKKDDDEIQMLEWMQAAIKTYASNEEAYARLLAAAKDYDENGDTIQEGIARINAFVEKDSNGKYVAGSSLSSMIDNGVNTSLSEVFTENSSNAAVSGLYSRLRNAEIDSENASNIADLALDTVWGLQGRVEQLEDGSTVSESEIINAIINNEDQIVSQTSLINKASLNEATSTLTAGINGVSARVDLCVKKDSNGVIESGVTLNADKINIDSSHQLNLQSPYVNIDANEVNMSGLIRAINGDDSSVVIDADKINVGGILIAALNVTGIDELVANKVTAQVGNIDNIVTEKIDAKMDNLEIDAQNVTGIENIVVERLVATKTGAGTTTVDGNGFFIEGVQSESAIRSDGSGYFADGAISWNTNGDITLGSKFINAVNADVSVNSLEAGSSNKIYVDSSRGVYVDGTCDSQINPDGSGYLGNNGNSSAIAWNTDGSGSIANGAITWRSFSNKYLALAVEAGEMMIGSFGSGYAMISSDRIGVASSGVKGVRMFSDRSDGTPSLWVYDADANCHYLPTGPSISSDMRKKDVIENENISIEDIADAPLFKYRMKGCQDGCVQIGSSAQYWQDLVPEAVSSDEEGYLRMNYITLNTVASLTSAKEIVKLKEENATLKQRVEALEARLQLIENKLNA